MDRCDVLVVGGGPAGSTCAWRLGLAGFDVVVLDRATFPRDKVCAGWITPAVVEALKLDLGRYGATRTLQPFTGFRCSLMHGDPRPIDFGRIISYGVRRREFDAYLLERSRARVLAGEPLVDLRRDGAGWIANGRLRASLVVGAGGHFCPVARDLNAGARHAEEVVVAQEIEFPLLDATSRATPVRDGVPDLFFWPDLMGYGWCVRKGAYLNVGAGRLARSGFPAAMREFVAMLEARDMLPEEAPRSWKGHAYLLNRTARRRVHDDGRLLVGDAAGLALAPSGEGILAAVESGSMAADTIRDACGDFRHQRLASYERRIVERFGPRARAVSRPPSLPAWLIAAAARAVFHSRRLTRRLIVEDGMLHLRRPSLRRE